MTEDSTPLVDEVRAFLDTAIDACGRSAAGTAMRGLVDRLDQPLRVAIAGRPGTGKSTLVNALIGAEVAATRGSERASIATWYRDGAAPRVLAQSSDDERIELVCSTEGGLFDVELASHLVGDVSRLVVEWSSRALRDMTLVDLPGGTPPSHVCADALIYVMPQVTADDIAFLEVFHGDGLGRPLAVNAIGVLSRIDELGVDRDDALDYGRRLSHVATERPDVRRLCQTVVPAAGLLAQGAATIRPDEIEMLRTLAASPPAAVAWALGSSERFARASSPDLPAAPDRQWLLLRFGLFGVRVAITGLRDRPADASRLAAVLSDASGLDDLRRTIDVQLGSRPDLLKARSVLRDAKAVLHSQPPPGSAALLTDVERIESAAHELNELRVLHAIQSGLLHLPMDAADDATRLLGAAGATPRARLGLGAESTVDDAWDAATDSLRRWQRRTVDPTAAPLEVHASATVVRTCEGILEELA